ncbi:MAG: DUF3471 domain-containing protein [Candidatus Aminicenantes bacterium]|nr:MAG: DUF3471 domain-containing protein [Candidatus Aminicenantes bacterium]
MQKRRLITGGLLFVCFFFLVPVHWVFAEVAKIEITSRQVFADGMKFGNVGAYEKIKGRLHYSVDPGNPANSRIVDLKYAPKNEKGRVEFVGEFILLKPVDLQKGNHRMIFDVNNRGNLVILGSMNNALGNNDPSQPAHAGNGFLMREGYTLLWAEWNWDVRPGFNRMQLDLPIAFIDGKPITQEIAAEIVLIDTPIDKVSKCEPITWGDSRGYPAADIDDRSTARLTVRETPRGKRTLIPQSQWRFARLEGDRLVPDPTYLYLEPGFQLGRIYELIYVAKNPRVGGLGLAAARDAISFFRFNTIDRHNQPNPLTVNQNVSQLKPDPEKVYIFGVSQSGRFITHMIYQGFHVDEAGRMVIDGARIHVGGAGKGGFNHRFGYNTNIPCHLELNYMPGDFFPFNFAPQEDPLTGQKGDVLAVAKKLGKIPYIMVTNNEAEYWTRSASLLHTDVLGKKDAPVHEKVRIYFTCGAGHYASPTRERGICDHSLNVINHYSISRALLRALDRWVTDGVAPPPSSYPRIDRHELITAGQHKKQFPKIPGMRHPGRNLQPPRVNYGDKFWQEGIITVVPPEMGEPHITLVPHFDSDGNSIGGIRLPELQVPLGTYQGWNPRQAKYGAPEFMVPFEGSFWPFAITEAQRKKTNDPRPSIEARYPTKQVYVEKVGKAVKDLIRQGFMLEEDGKKYIQDAKNMAWPPEPINQYPTFWRQEKRIKEPKAIKVDPKIYDAYVGQYEIEGVAVVTILKENNSLLGRIGEQQKFELFPETETKYFIKEFLARGLTFIKNDRGKVIKVLIHTDWGDLIAKKIR